jgi:hypothetical protein
MGAPGRISQHTPASLARLRYKGQDTHILTFAEFLALVGGGPLLVEVKTNSATPLHPFLDKIARQARAYKGPIALMSFDLEVVAALAKLAPTVPRGPVIGLPARWWAALGSGQRDHRAPAQPHPPGSGFLAVDVTHAAAARAWMTRHAIDLPSSAGPSAPRVSALRPLASPTRRYFERYEA